MKTPTKETAKDKRVAKTLDEKFPATRTSEQVRDFDIPEGAEVVDLRELLFFSIGGYNFCVPLVEIVSVTHIEDILLDMDLGELPPICKGFIRFRRQEVPLLDLRPKLHHPDTHLPEGASGLMIDYGVTFMGLLVDYVFNIEGVDQGYSLKIPPNVSELGTPFLTDYIVYPGDGAFRLSTTEFLTDEDLEALSSIL